MTQVSGSLAGLMIGGGAPLEAGRGGAEYARQSTRASSSESQSNQPYSAMPTFASTSISSSIPAFTSATSDDSYTNAMWHSDLQFWGLEGMPGQFMN